MPRTKGQQPKALRLTIAEASREFRVHRHTLHAALVAAGHECGAGAAHSIYDIAAALFGDEEKAKIRDTMASAALKEQKFRRLSRELLERSEVERIIAQVMSPLRQIITGASAELSAKVNPQDPHFARAAIEAWRDSKLVQVREEVAKAAMEGSAEVEDESEE